MHNAYIHFIKYKVNGGKGQKQKGGKATSEELGKGSTSRRSDRRWRTGDCWSVQRLQCPPSTLQQSAETGKKDELNTKRGEDLDGPERLLAGKSHSGSPNMRLLGRFLLCEPNRNREQSDFLEKNSCVGRRERATRRQGGRGADTQNLSVRRTRGRVRPSDTKSRLTSEVESSKGRVMFFLWRHKPPPSARNSNHEPQQQQLNQCERIYQQTTGTKIFLQTQFSETKTFARQKIFGTFFCHNHNDRRRTDTFFQKEESTSGCTSVLINISI